MKNVTILEALQVQVDDQVDLISLWPANDVASPDLVLYAGSGELEIMTQADVSKWTVATQQRYPNAQHQFVSMACNSLHAAILEFERSKAQCAYVFLLEISKKYLQKLLDSALGDNPDPITVHACAGRVVLRKATTEDIKESDLVVRACSILAKPKGLMSDVLLLKKLQNWIGENIKESQPVELVSFQVSSTWSDQLLMGFKRWVQDSPAIAAILPSYETGEDHYLALKPLLELQRYHSVLPKNNMMLATLGGGGRLGVLLLQMGRKSSLGFKSESVIPITLEDINLGLNQVIERVSPPRYCEINYRNDNAYFFSGIQRLL